MDHEYIGQLLGFTLAHSASVVEPLQVNEAMVPYAITFKDDEQDLVNFEADTQQEAVNKAEQQLAEFVNSKDAWAYSQEGVLGEGDDEVSVLYFKVWLKGMKLPLEAYQAFSKAPLKLLGNIQIQNYVATGMQEAETESFIAGLNQGVDIHPTAGSRWDEWCGNDDKEPDDDKADEANDSAE